MSRDFDLRYPFFEKIKKRNRNNRGQGASLLGPLNIQQSVGCLFFLENEGKRLNSENLIFVRDRDIYIKIVFPFE